MFGPTPKTNEAPHAISDLCTRTIVNLHTVLALRYIMVCMLGAVSRSLLQIARVVPTLLHVSPVLARRAPIAVTPWTDSASILAMRSIACQIPIMPNLL